MEWTTIQERSVESRFCSPAMVRHRVPVCASGRTVAGEQNHVSTDSFASSCPEIEMAKIPRQHCEREEDPAVGHGAGAPVAMEHR